MIEICDLCFLPKCRGICGAVAEIKHQSMFGGGMGDQPLEKEEMLAMLSRYEVQVNLCQRRDELLTEIQKIRQSLSE